MQTPEELQEEIKRECAGMDGYEYILWCRNKIADMVAEIFVDHILKEYAKENIKDD